MEAFRVSEKIKRYELYPVENLEEMAKPFEMFDLAPGATVTLMVTGFDIGKTVIHPERRGKVLDVLTAVTRLYLDPRCKTVGAPWFDVTSKTLNSQLKPKLESGLYKDHLFVITKHGEKPEARFELQVIPMPETTEELERYLETGRKQILACYERTETAVEDLKPSVR